MVFTDVLFDCLIQLENRDAEKKQEAKEVAKEVAKENKEKEKEKAKAVEASGGDASAPPSKPE